MPINTLEDGAVNRFLRGHQASKDATVTHTLITGGKYHIDWNCRSCHPHKCIDVFRQKMAEGYQHACVPCLTEQHTAIFPMYVDVDLKVPVQDLTEETLHLMTTLVNQQLERFYKDASLPPITFECVVCTKSKAAPEVTPGMYKIGIHLHWPQLLVEIDSARQIRHSMAVALEKRAWMRELGVDRVVWNDVLDDAVYCTGLRMLGAPKAKKCTACSKSKDALCHVCNRMNNNHVIDESVYTLRMVVVGTAVDEERKARYSSNLTLLMRKTTVRSDEERVTPGYHIYDGCTLAPPMHTDGRKRKAPDDDSNRVKPRFRKQSEVTNPRVHAVARELLVQHSPNYAESRMTIRFDGKQYMVLLTGDGSGFCLNKGSPHGSQHVYMVIQQGKSSKLYESHMRCWCTKMIVRPVSGQTCKEYRSPHKTLTSEQAARLFSSQPAPGGGSSTDKLKEIETQIKDLAERR